MKKFLNIMAPIFIMLAVSLICICVYMFFSNKIKQKNQVTTTVYEDSYINEEKSVVLAKDELPKFDSTISLQPLVVEIMKDFTTDDSLNVEKLGLTDTDSGYRKLISGDVDFFFSIEPSEAILRLASEANVEFEMVPIAREGFVFVVSNQNPINSIKISDIQKIYNGQIKNWSQIGGEDVEIKAFQKTETSATQTEMKNTVMKTLTMIEPLMSSFKTKEYGVVNDLIATFDNSKGALGYCFYHDAMLWYNTDSAIENSTKLLQIDGISPDYDNLKEGKYPFVSTYYLVRIKGKTTEQMEVFEDALFSERGKNIVKEAGYIDIE